MRFSILYQQLRCLVNGVCRVRGARRAVSVAFLIVMLLAVPLRQARCLTAEEIAYLKKSGVSDETIQLMLQQEAEGTGHPQTGVWEVEDEKGKRFNPIPDGK
ncbi:MAG: hypothetical protein GTN81_15720 [Proteobacteria bacterium]|nr:hypothetical protein [Pseudomonadota bacterium]